MNLYEVTCNDVILFELNASAKGMKWCYTVVAIRNFKRKGDGVVPAHYTSSSLKNVTERSIIFADTLTQFTFASLKSKDEEMCSKHFGHLLLEFYQCDHVESICTCT